MDVELLRQLGQRLLALDGGQSHLCFESRAVIPARSSRHRLSCSRAILAALRQKLHSSACPNLLSQLWLHWKTLRVLSARKPRWLQAGQVNPSRQRMAKSASRHAASVPNRSRNAASLRPRTARRTPSADVIPGSVRSRATALADEG